MPAFSTSLTQMQGCIESAGAVLGNFQTGDSPTRRVYSAVCAFAAFKQRKIRLRE
jgi:hypothetical protein